MVAARGLLVSLVFLALLSSCATAGQQVAFGIGVNTVGGQLDLRLDERWLGELRYVMGESDDATSRAYSARASRLFAATPRLHGYLGAELAAVSIKSQGRRISGAASGAFAGVEFAPLKAVRLRVDAGPYSLLLKEAATGTSTSSLVFVANSAIVYYFY